MEEFLRLKTKGNDCVAAENYGQATIYFTQALQAAAASNSMTPEELAKVYSNRSFCRLPRDGGLGVVPLRAHHVCVNHIRAGDLAGERQVQVGCVDLSNGEWE